MTDLPRVRGHRSRHRVTTLNEGPSKTQQHFKDECDINRIIKRFDTHGVIEHLNSRPQTYGVASAQTFTEAMHTVSLATEEFGQLPSSVRAHFANDPALYLDALQDPLRRSEFEKLGLIDPEPTPDPQKPTEQPSEPSQPDPPGSVLEPATTVQNLTEG